jgi:hypothetical protein
MTSTILGVNPDARREIVVEGVQYTLAFAVWYSYFSVAASRLRS